MSGTEVEGNALAIGAVVNHPAVKIAESSESIWRTILSDVLPLLISIAFFGSILWALVGRPIRQGMLYESNCAFISSHLPEVFAKLEYRQIPKTMEPDVVWSGKRSTHLLTKVRESEEARSLGTIASTHWEMLGRAQSGRFFQVEYVLARDEDCVSNSIDCAVMRSLTPLTDAEARLMIFKENKPALYKEQFGEEMPQREVDA